MVSWDDQQVGGETPTQYVSIPQQPSNPQTTPNNSKLLYAVIGGLVAVILIGGAYLFLVGPREKDTEKARIGPSNISTNSNPANVSNDSNNAAGEERYHAATNSGVDPVNANITEKNNKADKENAEKDAEPPKSGPKTKWVRKGYNGRVIMMNAIVRSSPSIYAPEIYIVSFDEPIKIGKSAGGNNPWFRVTTTGGTTGWMHGNTIEFVR